MKKIEDEVMMKSSYEIIIFFCTGFGAPCNVASSAEFDY